jgi:hypothetical protein
MVTPGSVEPVNNPRLRPGIGGNTMTTTYPLTIIYDLSPAGQKASLLAGGDGKRQQAVTGEIDPAEINHPLISVHSDGTLRQVHLDYCGVTLDNPGWRKARWVDTHVSPFGGPLTWEQAWELAKSYHAERARQREALQPEYDAALLADREREARKRTQEADAKRSRAEFEAKQEERNAALVEALKSWAVEHGSPLLRARIEEDFDWPGLARREYADSVLSSVGLPVGYPWGDGCEDRERPTLEEIETLRRYREALGDRATVSLAWYTPVATDELGYPLEEQPDGATALVVDVNTPDDKQVNRVIPLSEIVS